MENQNQNFNPNSIIGNEKKQEETNLVINTPIGNHEASEKLSIRNENKSKKVRILFFLGILAILIVTVVVGCYLLVNLKNNNLLRETVNVSENKSLPANTQDEKLAEKRKQMEAQKRPNPPQGFLSIDVNKLPSSCSLKSSTFTEKLARYHYECASPQQSQYNLASYLNYWEDKDTSLDDEVKKVTESKAEILKVVKDFSYQNSKGVIVGTFMTYDKDFKNPMEFRLYWMHGNNLVMIHTTDVYEFTQEKLIEILKSLK